MSAKTNRLKARVKLARMEAANERSIAAACRVKLNATTAYPTKSVARTGEAPPMTETLDQIRDWHARRLGWYETTGYWWKACEHCPAGAETQSSHPVPPTLDAIAGLMPPNVRTFKSLPTRDGGPVCWEAVDSGHIIVASVLDTGDELLDRARLAKLAWEAEGAK